MMNLLQTTKNGEREAVAYALFCALMSYYPDDNKTVLIIFDRSHPEVSPPAIRRGRPVAVDLSDGESTCTWDEDGLDISTTVGEVYVPWDAVTGLHTPTYAVELGPSSASVSEPTHLLGDPLRGVPGGIA